MPCSHAATAAEQKYSITELEVAALVYALEHFEVYALGNQVTVFTDHKALVQSYLPYLKSQTKGILACWYLRLARFLPTLKLKYKPGSVNVVAEALPRAPIVHLSNTREVSSESAPVGGESDMPNNLQFVQEQQREDSQLARLMRFPENKELPSDPSEAKVVLSQVKKGYYVMREFCILMVQVCWTVGGL